MTTSLTDLREQLNMSRAELAQKTGIASETIGLLERGLVRKFHPRTVRKIAEALGVHPTDIAEFAHLTTGDAPSQGPRPLREIRQQAYLSLVELAGMSGVPYSIIGLIELHKTKAPLWIMELLANALGVSSADISESEIGPN